MTNRTNELAEAMTLRDIAEIKVRLNLKQKALAKLDKEFNELSDKDNQLSTELNVATVERRRAIRREREEYMELITEVNIETEELMSAIRQLEEDLEIKTLTYDFIRENGVFN